MAEISANKRIAKNTLMLYFRQILIMGVSLYTVRVVLNTLGAEDYGIYNVVAGVVTMFSFLSGAMATASQRYFSYELGKNDYVQLKKIFGITLTVYVIFIAILILLAETIGLWFVLNKLVIPSERLPAAVWVYQFSVVSFVLTFFTAPYMSLIIAHEYMNVYAYISIVEVFLKLVIVFMIKLFSYDKLFMYGFLLLGAVFINTSLYRVVCKKKFDECKLQLVWDKVKIKEMVSFIGWNFFGSFASIVKNQGYSICINLFFGPVVNAAQGLSTQVRSAVTTFSQNFSLAVRPQIVKTYASNDISAFNKLLIFSCKITYLLMLIITIPLFTNMDFVLSLWLKSPPDYTASFVKLLLVESLIESISYPMATANQATGKIALYQFLIGTVIVLNLPFSYIILKMGYPPYYIYLGGIIFTLFVTITRLLFLQKISFFNIKKFILKALMPVFAVTVISFFLCFLVQISNGSLWFFLIDVLVKNFIIIFVIFLFGFAKSERNSLKTILKSKIMRRGK